ASRDAVDRTKAENGELAPIKRLVLRRVFTSQRRLKALARALRLARRSGLQALGTRPGLLRRIAPQVAELEPLAPQISPRFSDQMIAEVERPEGEVRYRVALLKGCVMNVAFAEINRQTADVLLANGCEVHLPAAQQCCGS